MTRLLLAVAVMAAFLLPPAPAAADARFARLSQPGTVAIMRHALAPGSGDTGEFALDDCTTQRNLDARGKAQAQAIRAAAATGARASYVPLDTLSCLSPPWA